MVVYQLMLTATYEPVVERSVQKWRRPESMEPPRPSSVFSKCDPLTRGVCDNPSPSKKGTIDAYDTTPGKP